MSTTWVLELVLEPCFFHRLRAQVLNPRQNFYGPTHLVLFSVFIPELVVRLFLNRSITVLLRKVSQPVTSTCRILFNVSYIMYVTASDCSRQRPWQHKSQMLCASSAKLKSKLLNRHLGYEFLLLYCATGSGGPSCSDFPSSHSFDCSHSHRTADHKHADTPWHEHDPSAQALCEPRCEAPPCRQIRWGLQMLDAGAAGLPACPRVAAEQRTPPPWTAGSFPAVRCSGGPSPAGQPSPRR